MNHVIYLIAFFSLVAASNALAQSSRGPNGAAKERARAAYARGQELYKTGKYEEAEAAYREAFVAVPNPVMLLGVAESQKKLGRASDAVATLQTYLEMRPEATNREEVERKISDIRASPATVVVASDPPGASVVVDGAGTGKVTPTEIDMTAGGHSVRLSLPGYAPFTQMLTVQSGTRHELRLALRASSQEVPLPSSGADVHEISTAPSEKENHKGANTAPWIVTGIGVLALGSGAVLGAAAIGEKSDFDKKPTKATAYRGKRLTLLADVAFGVGAAALITGVVLFLTAGGGDEKDTDLNAEGAGQAAHLRVTPALSPSCAGMATRLQF
jgi:tetratricopeptide (TPR) repeat protein